MHTIAIVQARMGSTRLPGKVLMPLGDKPVLQWVVERTRAAIPDVVIATTEEPADEAIAALGRMLNVPVVRYGIGLAVNDVLTRFRRVLEQFPCDAFVRVTADCPMIEPRLLEVTASSMGSLSVDFYDCSMRVGIADGLDCEGVRTASFLTFDENALGPDAREHVTLAMVRQLIVKWTVTDAAGYILGGLTPFRRDPVRYRLTLDTQRDYERLQRIWAEVPHGPHGPDTLKALAWLEQHPEWWGYAPKAPRKVSQQCCVCGKTREVYTEDAATKWRKIEYTGYDKSIPDHMLACSDRCRRRFLSEREQIERNWGRPMLDSLYGLQPLRGGAPELGKRR